MVYIYHIVSHLIWISSDCPSRESVDVSWLTVQISNVWVTELCMNVQIKFCQSDLNCCRHGVSLLPMALPLMMSHSIIVHNAHSQYRSITSCDMTATDTVHSRFRVQRENLRAWKLENMDLYGLWPWLHTTSSHWNDRADESREWTESTYVPRVSTLFKSHSQLVKNWHFGIVGWIGCHPKVSKLGNSKINFSYK